jgi:hypothetical protein
MGFVAPLVKDFGTGKVGGIAFLAHPVYVFTRRSEPAQRSQGEWGKGLQEILS